MYCLIQLSYADGTANETFKPDRELDQELDDMD